MSTQDVLNHHLGSFGAGDVEETMKDYTEESVLITGEATLKGLAQLRAFFTEGYAGLFRPGTFEFTMDRMDVSGDVALIVWHTKGDSADIPLGTDTFVMRDGKIAVQTLVLSVEPK